MYVKVYMINDAYQKDIFRGNLRNVTNVVNLNVNRSFNRFPSFKEETLDIYPQTYHHSLLIASKEASVQNKTCGDGNGI